MDLHRIQFKFFIEDPASIDTEATVRVFNRWISEAKDEVLVDVADYSHVPHGPVTLLAGHEANYSIDNAGGELGLLYARKQPLEGDLDTRLLTACRAALGACNRLVQDPEFEGKLRFRAGDLLFVANDRLSAPNDEATRAAFEPVLSNLLKRLYGGADSELTSEPDTRRLFSLRARTTDTSDTAALLANLAA